MSCIPPASNVSDVIHYLCSLYRLSSDIDAPEVPFFYKQKSIIPPRNETFFSKVDDSQYK